jgi:hypothetical protein
MTAPQWHLNNDHSTAVSDDVNFYRMDSCPKGPKVLLLTKTGTAVLGTYKGESVYEAWHPIPARPVPRANA